MKYTKKNNEVEAVQITKELAESNPLDLSPIELVGKAYAIKILREDRIKMPGVEETQEIVIGDYLVKASNNRYSLVNKAEFEEEYSPVEVEGSPETREVKEDEESGK